MTSVSSEVAVGSVGDLLPGEGRAYAVAGTQIAVFRMTDGTLRATDAVCPHKGGPLADGQFDLGRGQSGNGRGQSGTGRGLSDTSRSGAGRGPANTGRGPSDTDPSATGQPDMGQVVCPLHQYSFRFSDGQCASAGIEPVRVYRAEDRAGEIVVWL